MFLFTASFVFSVPEYDLCLQSYEFIKLYQSYINSVHVQHTIFSDEFRMHRIIMHKCVCLLLLLLIKN